jgi:predicted ATPase
VARGLEVLSTLSETRERARQELDLQLTLALASHAIHGQAAPEVERAYARARDLCGQVEDAPKLFRALLGLYRFYGGRMERQTAREIVEQLYKLAQRVQDPDLLLLAHMARGTMLCLLGELVAARDHLEQAIALHDPQRHRSHAFLYSLDPGVTSLSRASWTLWMLGYPDQARRRSQETLT